MRPLAPWLLALAVTLAPAAAFAAPDHWVGYGWPPVTIHSPNQLVADSAWTATTAFSIFTGHSHAYAMNGGVGMDISSSTDFLSGYGYSTGFTENVGASTNDFVITGPPGVTSVVATFHFVLQGRVEISGGWVNGSSNGAIYSLWGAAAGNTYWGQMNVGIGTATGQGSFTGLDVADVGMDAPVTGTFPVGSPFQVRDEVFLTVAHYGNITVTPSGVSVIGTSSPEGFVAGVGNGLGIVMDLPSGYDLSSPSWNVVHNRVPSTLDVPHVAPPARLALALGTGNPSSGPVVLRFALPADGPVSLVLYDVSGRQVRALARGWRAAGTQSVTWDGRDDAGAFVAPGVYLAAVRAGGESASARLVRTR
jgi:hypothetical protein